MLAGVQVGAATVATRFVVAEVPPFTLAMLRYAVGFACLLPFAAAAWRTAPARSGPVPARDLLAMATLGVFQFGILVALYNLGLRHVPSGPAAMIFSLMPLLTLLLAGLLGQERLSPRLLGGVLLSLAGVAAALSPKLQAAGGSHWLGEWAVLAAAAVGGSCSVLYRPYLQRYPTLPVSALAMLASVAFLAVAAAAAGEHWPARIAALDVRAWAIVAFIGLSSAVGYFCWLHALKHLTPTRVTVFLALSPATAAIGGWLLLDEPLGAQLWIALPLIASGLWLASARGPAAHRRAG